MSDIKYDFTAAVNVSHLCLGSVTKAYWLDNYQVKFDI